MNILIVEDNSDTLSFLINSFKKEGFVVDFAKEGNLGCKKALSNDYDLIILDNSLPNKTGREICETVRKKGRDSRILMLSVDNLVETKAGILNLGADDYLSKPFSYKELLARTRALLRRPKEQIKEKLKYGKLVLDSKEHTITYSNKKIKMTPKEFSLLEYLMRNKGITISRTEILEHIWDMNADLFTNTVETHIMNIRKKLGLRGKKSIIHTIIGAGYKIP